MRATPASEIGDLSRSLTPSSGLVGHERTDECIPAGGNLAGNDVAGPGWWVGGVMRVTTLKATAGRLDGLLAYYVGLAEDRGGAGPGRGPVDYYLDPDEPAGQWRGQGRHALGLDGPVLGEELRTLLDGHDPHTGHRLGRRFGESSARGFDATFSAPKSVSVLWALTPDPWVRAEVLAAHDAAVDAALDWFERHGAVTRRGRDGVLQVDTRGITAAVFRQHTSRTVDPQLHSHAVISAKVQDDTGTWLALDARFLKYQQRTIGWIYDAALRTEMTNRLGVDWVERDISVFDLRASLSRCGSRSPSGPPRWTPSLRNWSEVGPQSTTELIPTLGHWPGCSVLQHWRPDQGRPKASSRPSCTLTGLPTLEPPGSTPTVSPRTGSLTLSGALPM